MNNIIIEIARLRDVAMRNQVALNKLLRQEPLDWNEIEETAHDQRTFCNRIMLLAGDAQQAEGKQASFAMMQQDQEECNPRSAQTVLLSFSMELDPMPRTEEISKEDRKQVIELLAQAPH